MNSACGSLSTSRLAAEGDEDQRQRGGRADDRDERAGGAELEQLGVQQCGHARAPVSVRNASSSERARGCEAEHRDPLVAGDLADLLGRRAERRAARRRRARPGGRGARARRSAGPGPARGPRSPGRRRRRAPASRVPWARSSPSAITTTSSTDCATSARTWLETSTARPPAACSRSSPRSQRDAGRVEAVGRLVEDQHLRVAEQRRGDRQALAHAHRVALHAPVGGVGRGRRRPAPRRRGAPDARRWRRGPAGGCGRCGPGGRTRPRAPRRRGCRAARARRSAARRTWPSPTTAARARAARAAWCSCRRRWGRGSRSRDRPGCRRRAA